MHKRSLSFIALTLVFIVMLIGIGAFSVFSQDYKNQVKSVLYFQRGLLWDTITGLIHTSLYSFTRNDHGYDFPGFKPDIVQAANVGTYSTHHFGLCQAMAANRKPVYPGTPLQDDYQFQWINTDGGVYPTNMDDSTTQYVMVKSKFRWENGENYFLKADPLEAEEVVDVALTYNPNFAWGITTPTNRHHMPLRVENTIRQWSGSRQNQQWFIHDWKFTNITDDPRFKRPQWEGTGERTLYDFVFQFAIAGEINLRSATFIGQGRSKDDLFYIIPSLNLAYQVDSDYLDSPQNDLFDYYSGGGPNGVGEYLAPSHLGTALIYTTPNRDGKVANMLGAWATRWSNLGLGTESPWFQGQNYFDVIVDMGRSGQRMVAADWGRQPIYTTYSTGFWDIAPGESVRIVFFSGMGCVDFETCYGPKANTKDIATGLDTLKRNLETAKLATQMALVDGYAADPKYKGWNIPDPPACPMSFDILPYYGEVPGNMIVWGDESEKVADADYSSDEAYDLAGYTIWRSEYLPFEGWRAVANVEKGKSYDAITHKYTFVDKAKEADPTAVKVGFSYYYAISSYDTGHKTWPPRPSAFPTGVPVLQSNLQASLNYVFDQSKWKPFRTQRVPGAKMADIRVVPNPFVMQAGYTTPRDIDTIQFVNIPAQCTIRIYSVRGILVQTLEHTDGSGTQVWNQRTLGEQFAESGIYVYQVESHVIPTKGQTYTSKFAMVR